jgi:hypothetical protein
MPRGGGRRLTMKKVEWLNEADGGKYPFCPYCHEFAYEQDHCVFCGEEYAWTEGVRTRAVSIGEYTVTQASNNNISIIKNDKLVYHAQCTAKLGYRRLKRCLEAYIDLEKGTRQ